MPIAPCVLRRLTMSLACIAGALAGSPAWADFGGAPYASASYDPLTGHINVSVGNIYSWYIESRTSGFTGAGLNLPAIPGALVTNNDVRIGHSSFDTKLSYTDIRLDNVAAASLFENDMFLRYASDYGVQEVQIGVLGGLEYVPPSAPTIPTPPTPTLPPWNPGTLPGNPPGGPSSNDVYASAVYDPLTGAINVSASNVYSWYVESRSESLLVGTSLLPEISGSLITNNQARVGQASFESPFSYDDQQLVGRATLGLPEGDMFLRYVVGFGMPEVEVPVYGGVVGAPAPTWPEVQPPQPPVTTIPPFGPEVPDIVIVDDGAETPPVAVLPHDNPAPVLPPFEITVEPVILRLADIDFAGPWSQFRTMIGNRTIFELLQSDNGLSFAHLADWSAVDGVLDATTLTLDGTTAEDGVRTAVFRTYTSQFVFDGYDDGYGDITSLTLNRLAISDGLASSLVLAAADGVPAPEPTGAAIAGAAGVLLAVRGRRSRRAARS